jgi:hypothetical protein
MVRAVALLAVALSTAAGGTAAAVPKPCGDRLQYGFIRSLAHTHGRWEMRFDPAFMWTGATANAAAGQTVPNDNYVVNESTRTYLFYVSPKARLFVLTPKHYLDGSPVSVETLARIVRGPSPLELYEPLATGFWMRYHVDTVCELRQQYQP